MSSFGTTILHRFRELPVILRIGVVAIAAAGVFAAARETTWSWAADAAREARLIETELQKAAQRPRVDSAIRDVVLAHGRIRLPAEESDARQAMTEAINRVVAGHRDVTNLKESDRPTARLDAARSGLVGPGQALERISTEVQFDSSAETAAAIIAELETDPAIDAISRAQISRIAETRTVNVRLTLEAWIVVAGRRRGA
ncbi:MAG TPA: hypothetical protein PKC43_02960 [Phycisphaerales bacterium]|nr:hypothetical protein [Phycisphaerales bacterium]HMP36387.1 hypothetical protein [Phycisphaerales bacterium]